MNIQDLQTVESDINQLKSNLHQFCEQFTISKFEADDIIELIEDGEDIEWIIDQLKSENAQIDIDKISSLLSEIKSIIGPTEEDEQIEDIDEEETITEDQVQVEMPDLSNLDLSQIDLSDLKDIPLPPGMKLPAGMDMKKIQKMLDTPQGKFMTDFTLFCQERDIDMMGGALTSDSSQMQELQDEWMATPRPAFDGKTPAEMLAEDPTLMPQKVETYKREAPKVGRNDPCPCGSGKKYKKCCGKK